MSWRPASAKTRQEILDSLLRSHDSIQLDLEEIRKRLRGGQLVVVGYK